jgi:hypothetical protein
MALHGDVYIYMTLSPLDKINWYWWQCITSGQKTLKVGLMWKAVFKLGHPGYHCKELDNKERISIGAETKRLSAQKNLRELIDHY